jgi:hypothetical protein
MWIVRVTRSELRQVRSPEYIGYRLTSLVPGVSTVITKVYSKLRGRACAWETSGLFRAAASGARQPGGRGVPAGLAGAPRSYVASGCRSDHPEFLPPTAEARRVDADHVGGAALISIPQICRHLRRRIVKLEADERELLSVLQIECGEFFIVRPARKFRQCCMMSRSSSYFSCALLGMGVGERA